MQEYIKNYILENLNNKIGQSVYGCELAKALFKNDKMIGSITCNASKSQENLKENMKYFEHVVAYNKINFGEEEAANLALDLLRSPEKAECCMVFCYIEAVVNNIMGNKKYKNTKLWDKKFTIDQDLIKWFIENIDEAIETGFSYMEEYTL